ncbi:hypothetical protein FRB94_005009 [Tulasnella sp. JGI-2019a]|nr:hypothetical protein FRB93_009580 [Tulasnella sp. JGI-2019a]KAG9012863.1 hypothetical protein FRB94_005009 [Tulasnella sp. JGI-2019a]KAG9037624.1 hypothetical protein FRB95_004844 [Tulasnella sp. JGI-2019a]
MQSPAQTPNEIWDLIAHHLNAIDRSHLQALCLVTRWLYDIALPHLYYDPFLGRLTRSRPAKLKQRLELCAVLMANQRIADLVRVYRSDNSNGRNFPLDHRVELAILPRLRNLTSLYQHASLGISVYECVSDRLQTLEVDGRQTQHTPEDLKRFWEWLDGQQAIQRLSLQGVGAVDFVKYPRALRMLKTLMADREAAMSILPVRKVKRFYTLGEEYDEYLDDLIPLFDDGLNVIHLTILVSNIPLAFDLLRKHARGLRVILISLKPVTSTTGDDIEVKRAIYHALRGFPHLTELHVSFTRRVTGGGSNGRNKFLHAPLGGCEGCPHLASVQWYITYIVFNGDHMLLYRIGHDVPAAKCAQKLQHEEHGDWYKANKLDEFDDCGEGKVFGAEKGLGTWS